MERNPLSSYLESQILSATPQRLRLLLIEGAIRFARQTIEHWEREEQDAAYETLLRARGIVTEIMTSFSAERSPLHKQIFSIYLCVFQILHEASLQRDSEKVREAIQVLEEERQTWAEVCEQHPQGPTAAEREEFAAKEITLRSAAEAAKGDAGSPGEEVAPTAAPAPLPATTLLPRRFGQPYASPRVPGGFSVEG